MIENFLNQIDISEIIRVFSSGDTIEKIGYILVISFVAIRILADTSIGKKIYLDKVYNFIISIIEKLPILRQLISKIFAVFVALNYKKGQQIVLKYAPLLFYYIENLKETGEIQKLKVKKFEIFKQELIKELQKSGVIPTEEIISFADKVVGSMHTFTKREIPNQNALASKGVKDKEAPLAFFNEVVNIISDTPKVASNIFVSIGLAVSKFVVNLLFSKSKVEKELNR